jgi:sulfoxide reductase catalytic subunit YedY
MPFIHIRPPWQLSPREVTPESIYLNRRRFLKGAVGAGIGGTILAVTGCGPSASNNQSTPGKPNYSYDVGAYPRNPDIPVPQREITNPDIAATYNNFYEFGRGKSIWKEAQALPTEPWQVEVTGLVKNPRTYDIDDLKKRFSLEERIYRFRCVEAWSMVLPWVGFPMYKLLQDVEPTAEAKYVSFQSFYDPKITKGPGLSMLGVDLPWPYTEGLRIEEMANELAFFATGIYGHDLPKQHGAPIRMVIPWKYGFKGAKSIVKIEFLAERPDTFWNVLQPDEYGFEANVNPNVPHPRWSQAQERFVGNVESFSYETRPTLMYNGYGEFVANLYET